MKNNQRDGDVKRSRHRILNGERLRRELSENNVQERNNRKGNGKGNRRDGRDIRDAEISQERLNDFVRNDRFADPTECQRREGDAELRCGENAVEVFRRPQSRFNADAAVFFQRVQLRRAHFHECKFRRDEKAVGDDQRNDNQNSQYD